MAEGRGGQTGVLGLRVVFKDAAPVARRLEARDDYRAIEPRQRGRKVIERRSTDHQRADRLGRVVKR